MRCLEISKGLEISTKSEISMDFRIWNGLEGLFKNRPFLEGPSKPLKILKSIEISDSVEISNPFEISKHPIDFQWIPFKKGQFEKFG